MGLFFLMGMLIASVTLVRWLVGDRSRPTPAEDEGAAAIGRALHGMAEPLGGLGGAGPIDFGPPPPAISFEPEGEHTIRLEE
jgi:hypothetical protein